MTDIFCKFFGKGWNNQSNFKYLPKDIKWKNKYSFACPKMIDHYREVSAKYDLNAFISFMDSDTIPTDELELDYFIHHNINIQFCFAFIGETLKRINEEIVDNTYEELEILRNEVYKNISEKFEKNKKNIALLQNWEDPKASDLAKQEIKELQDYIISTSKKKGKTYLSKSDKILLEDLQPYYNRDIEDKSDLWFYGITHEDFFRDLAKKYGKSKDGIKKFAQRHDPAKK